MRKRSRIENPVIVWKIILRWILKCDLVVWPGPRWLRLGTVGGHL